MRRTDYRTKAWRLWLPIGVLAAVASPAAIAGLTTQDLNTTTPDQLASALAGPGVTISNVHLMGARHPRRRTPEAVEAVGEGPHRDPRPADTKGAAGDVRPHRDIALARDAAGQGHRIGRADEAQRGQVLEGRARAGRPPAGLV